MKKLLIILAALAAAIVLSGCSGVIGGETSVLVSVPQLASDGRHLPNGDGSTVDEAYVLVLKEDKVYSLNMLEGDAKNYLIDGKVVIANLPVGEYIFGIALMDGNTNVGFALKEHTVNRGLNVLTMEVAPGILDCEIDGLGGLVELDNFFDPPEGVKLSFAENEVTIDYDRRSGDTVDFDVSFGGTPTVGPRDYSAIDGGTFESSGSVLEDASAGIMVTCSASYAGVDQDYTYRLILK